MPETAPLLRQRIDKWLWHARMARTRTLSARLVSDGHVRFNGQRITDPSRKVRAGDILTLALPHATLVISVTGFAEKRGSAPEAQRLYQLLSPTIDTADAALIADAKRDEQSMRNTDIGDDDEDLAHDDDCR